MSRWLMVLALLSGCGFGLSGPDPQQPREQMPKCDTGKGAVVVDGLMATVASVVALALVANDEPAGALIPAGIGAIYIGGAVHGSRAVDACRQRMDEWGEMVAARDQLRRGPPGGDTEDEDPRTPPKRVKVPPPVGPEQIADMPPEDVAQMPPQGPQQAPQQMTPQVPQVAPVAPEQQPPVAPPQPKQPKQAKQPKQPKQAPPPSTDDWTDFWREVQ